MSTRHRVLDAAAALLRTGDPVSLESVARATGLTKPGLMYHFPTKEALMLALVDHVVDGYERELTERAPAAGSSVEQRLAAYVDWVFTADIDRSDLVMFADPRLRDPLAARWAERLGAWIGVPDDLPDDRRAALHAARLMADGSWLADASGCLPLPAADRARVAALARALVEGRS